MKKIKSKKKKGKGTIKTSLVQEYFKKQGKLTKETLRKVADSVKRGVDDALK
jgi:hypothetical protein